MSKKVELDHIRTNLFSRGLSLAKFGLKAGMMVARGKGSPEDMKAFLVSQIDALTKELGELKGSIMKVGQMLSMYGEHFLPKEANDVLKSLQFQSPPVAWPAMRAALLKELGPERLELLDIDPTPFASASLGQVHRARRKKDGRELAIKIQYPGVDHAIDNDLRVLKAIFSLIHVIPKTPRFDEVFEEVRQMLHQEVDYELEAICTQKYFATLAGDERYLVPEVIPEFSTKRILTTSFLAGSPADHADVLALPLHRRNRLGEAFLNLYMRELLEFGFCQTDPHLGNYRIRIDKNGENDKLILLDYGAVRDVPLDFLRSYHSVMLGALDQQADLILRGGRGLKLLEEQDPVDLLRKYVELCFLITEPFALPQWNFAPTSLMKPDGVYNWGTSDLPNRVAKKASEIAFGGTLLRAPPREIIFLDRKLGGTFVFLSVLKCEFNARRVIDSLIHNPPSFQKASV
jgi:predicted unusual protein kinase regulating ubiquinone biosynthesis (AarF/ABC1/UbiB family)